MFRVYFNFPQFCVTKIEKKNKKAYLWWFILVAFFWAGFFRATLPCLYLQRKKNCFRKCKKQNIKIYEKI